MANRKKRPRPSDAPPPAAAGADGGEGTGGGRPATAWSAVAVDLAPPPGAATAPAATDDFDDAAAWTSRHYDGEDGDGDGDSAFDADLFDPDAGARSNAFDAAGAAEGAGDDGVFLSLEVIPGDAYRVERTGDETTGFVTRVVAASPPPPPPQDPGGAPPSKRERQQAKRARKRQKKREEARERERRGEGGGGGREDAGRAATGPPRTAPQEAPGGVTKAGVPAAADPAEELLAATWCPGVVLHPTLAAGLRGMGYASPTPVQRASLPAAVLGRRDIVGAAPTGSGKTLSYGLPLLQALLEGADAATPPGGGGPAAGAPQPLRALVVVPTRELALQVAAELEKVCRTAVKVATVVGGFAAAKQKRVLERTRPPVLVGTPGRLWELMSSGEYSHLNDLTQLRFLVIDEADRMIKQGSFPQLQQIFNAINTANPPPEDLDEDESDDDEDDEDRLPGLKGVPGEARVVMLDDSILERIERQRNAGGPPAPVELEDDEYEEERQRPQEEEESGTDAEEELPAPVHRQTFVYSATLTLPPSMHHLIKKDLTKKSYKRRRKNRQPTTVDGAIAEILDVAGAMGETKVIDLSKVAPEGSKPPKEDKTKKMSSKNSAKVSESIALATRLPQGLTLCEIRCAQRHKDSHLYAYLVTTHQGSSGPCLVFCNSIAAVRRVGDTLKTLGLPVKVLHAQMQQKSRLGALESLSSNSRAVVVASDVAARGLDIASVTTIIHYDVARVVDTFIHRAGRTARGVGDKAVGTSISLVAPAEEKVHQTIVKAVQGSDSKSLEPIHIDGRLMKEATTRVAFATKIVSCNDVESQATRKNKWLQDAAKEAGLDVDQDMLEGSLLDGDQRDRQRFLEAKRARTELRQLLAKPMRKQHFGKFLSGAGLRESIKAEIEVKPFVVKQSIKKRKPRRKKSSTNRKVTVDQ